jgi:ribosomal-protein-serine acetyltransferase
VYPQPRRGSGAATSLHFDSVLGIHVDDEIELRLHEERHAEELFRLTDANRDHLRAWLPWVDATTTAEDTRAYIRESLQRLGAGEKYGFAILHQGRVVGTIDLRVDREAGEAEVGYWLAVDAQGRGIVTRATAALMEFAFDALGLGRVVIRCADQNRRSRAVPERLGFKMEGILRQRDRIPGRPPMDQCVYGLLRSDWKSRRSGHAEPSSDEKRRGRAPHGSL